MLSAVQIFAFLIVASSQAARDVAAFSYLYGESIQNIAPGPDEWALEFPGSCAGRKQSPIDIVTSDIDSANVKSAPLIFSPPYANPPTGNLVLKNDGHTVHLATTATDLTVKGGDLLGAYKLVDIHFHWGGGPYRGSEHTINGKPYALEMHAVHIHPSYATVDAAKNSNDTKALAVLGVLFEESENDNPFLNPIVNNLFKVEEANSTFILPSKFALQMLFPLETADFYRYEGSLTTPGCNEVVTWSVFKRRLPISERQLALFRDVRSDLTGAGGIAYPMYDNFRPTQPLNGRLVKRYIAPGTKVGTCPA